MGLISDKMNRLSILPTPALSGQRPPKQMSANILLMNRPEACFIGGKQMGSESDNDFHDVLEDQVRAGLGLAEPTRSHRAQRGLPPLR